MNTVLAIEGIVILLTFLFLGVYCIHLRRKLGLDDDLEE